MDYSECLTLFNNFDKNYDKENNVFATYLDEAKTFIYFRNLQTIYSEEDLYKLFYTDFTFTIGETTISGTIFNVIFNNINQYINPNVIFTKDTIQPVLNGLLPCEINVVENKGDGQINYDFIISLI